MAQHSEKKYPPPLSIRLTLEERMELEKAAIGMSLSAYIRSRLFGNNVAPRRLRRKSTIKNHEVLVQILASLGRSKMANNLNQLAKASNMGSLPLTPDVESDLKEGCLHIRDIRTMLINALDLKSEEHS